MDITPDPRLLKMLGEIEFEEWQCLAELIDNSFDSFLKLEREGKTPGPGGWQVRIELPKVGDENGSVKISDNGPGMSMEQLNRAVRAGFSSNDRYSNLGLFGMGFNVSTARLGNITTITTHRSVDEVGSRVSIDFNKLIETRSFDAEEKVVEKDYPNSHGTEIEISNLKRDRAAFMSRNAESIANKLGMIYAHLLDTKGFVLFVQGKQVKPYRHCAWSETRSVKATFGSGVEAVPARIVIDKDLSSLATCSDCGDERPLEESHLACRSCGETQFHERKRKIWGWIGIQRYLHPSEYGLDFLRNGRKILVQDKKLFSWKNPNDPNASEEIEYPSELAHQGGRIIGEIHLDHVPVSYTKDNFEYSDREWKFMVDLLRGIGPMRPQKAKQAGYEENLTPLAKLYKAYKGTGPGYDSLIPGDGNQAIHVTTREWGNAFRAGDPDYQDDSKWWLAVEEHERIKSGPGPQPQPDPGDRGSIFDIIPGASGPEKRTQTPTQKPGGSLIDEVDHLKLHGHRDQSLSGEYSVTADIKIQLETFILEKIEDSILPQFPSGVRIMPTSSDNFTCFIWKGHPLFSEMGLEITETLLSELSYVVGKRYGIEPSQRISEALARGKFGHLGRSLADLREDTRAVMGKLADSYAENNQLNAQSVLAHLKPFDEQALIDAYSLKNGGRVPSFNEPDILNYLTPTLLLQLFEVFPESFLNGKVFSFSLEENISEITKRHVKWRLFQVFLPLVSLLEDDDIAKNMNYRHLSELLAFFSKELA